MKKIFSRGSKPSGSLSGFSGVNSNSNHDLGSSSSSSSGLSSANPGGGSAGSGHASFSGTTWSVGRHTAHFEDVIAEGGFGMVFLVKVKGPAAQGKKWFALKRLFVNNDKDLAVCKREINIVSNLNGHKNLIGYVDSSITLLDGGVHEVLLLMPYHKTTLLQLMNDRLSVGFTEPEVLDIFCDICAAISRLHHCQTPIIHRDLKVENVLQSEEGGHFILCDFGSATAKVLSPATQGITQVEEEIKRYTTLSYRAPEMIDLYNELPLTSKTDVWALGCMLFKTCYFTLPFAESSLAIQAGNFTFPDKPKYSTELKKLIVYLLTVDVDARPDIFQAAHLGCELAKRKCNVQNLRSVDVPSFANLSEKPLKPASEKEKEQKAASKPVSASATSSKAPSGVSAQTQGAALFSNSPNNATNSNNQAAEGSNTTIAPRQRPRGGGLGTKPSGGILPLPSPSKAPSTNKNPFTGANSAVTASNVPAKAPVSNNGSGYNPFSTGFTSDSQQPQSLPAQPSGSGSNPFVTSTQGQTQGQPQGQGQIQGQTKVKPGWNPFEDAKKFSELSEDALFGEQMDQLRMGDSEGQGHLKGQGQIQRSDPFVSAPFAPT